LKKWTRSEWNKKKKKNNNCTAADEKQKAGYGDPLVHVIRMSRRRDELDGISSRPYVAARQKNRRMPMVGLVHRHVDHCNADERT